mmetsp:Transcript_3195/g.6537  ORF Transcript_3195/g.6537 Transcript_3195/m.6537 type:complete len:412 (+) Transcript_3195:748-1983(+)
MVVVPEALTNIDPPERNLTSSTDTASTDHGPRHLLELLERRVDVVTSSSPDISSNGQIKQHVALRRRTPTPSHLYTFSRFEPQDAEEVLMAVRMSSGKDGVEWWSVRDADIDGVLAVAPDLAPLPGYFQHVNEYVLSVLVPPRARRVLDVGCGAGATGAALKRARLNDGVRVVVDGVEPHRLAAKAARGVLDTVHTGMLDDALPFIPDGVYDCIILADVLEHLVFPDKCLASLRSKLAPGGIIGISVPNVRFWPESLSLFLSGKWDVSEDGVKDATHVRYFTIHGLRETIKHAGYDINGEKAVVVFGKQAPTELNTVLRELGVTGDDTEADTDVRQYLLELSPRSPLVGRTVRKGVVVGEIVSHSHHHPTYQEDPEYRVDPRCRVVYRNGEEEEMTEAEARVILQPIGLAV